MKFKKYGRSYQLKIADADDLRELLTLDESLWVATSAPVSAFRMDPAFLAFLDRDHNGRINSEEVKAAVQWLLDRLTDTSAVADASDDIPVSFIDSTTPEGEALVSSANYVLGASTQAPADRISLGAVRSFLASVHNRKLNGDGVVVPEIAEDQEIKTFLHDIVQTTGGAADASEGRGAGEQQINQFLNVLPAYSQWRKRDPQHTGSEASEILVFGPQTTELHALLQQHEGVVDHFFYLCGLAEFEPATVAQATLSGNLPETDLMKPDDIRAYLEKRPIATPNQNGILPLQRNAINPLYSEWLQDLRQRVVEPVLGCAAEELRHDDWQAVKAAFAPFKQYHQENPAPFLDALPVEKVEAYQNPRFEQTARQLLADDQQVREVLAQTKQVERLLLFHKHLLRFVNNFVSFPQLYASDQHALFEMGSIVMDGRWFNFAVKVPDIAAHTTVAKMSNLYVTYVEVMGAPSGPFTVVMPITSGTKGNVMVGKRGVYFDLDGVEYDARVTQIIENPVSIREALAAPFVRLWRLVVGKIETWSNSSEQQLEMRFNQAISKPAPLAEAPPPTQTRLAAGGLVTGIAISAAALGSAFAFITKTLAGMESGNVLLGVIIAAAIVIFPISLVAILKMRFQDLSSLLEGCGWAINARMLLTHKQRHHFTCKGHFPKHAHGTPRRRFFVIIVVVLLLVAIVYFGLRLYQDRSGDTSSSGDMPRPTTENTRGLDPS